jgi:hypothetical protein
MCWCILRGWPVAYRLRIENGGFVIDGSKPGGMYVECEVIGATLVSDPSDSTARCPAGTCAASGWNAITGKNITDFRAN